MRVLIAGATGFVGHPIAKAYVHAGHIVYGVTRSSEKARALQAEEIIPIIASTVQEWTHLIPSLDIVIEATATTGPDADLESFKLISEAAKGRPPHHKLTFIYTSGTWSHGSSEEMKDERNGRYTPVPLVAWRPGVEDEFLADTNVNTIVIRPGLVYGRSASIIGTVFQAAQTAKLNGESTFTWAGTPESRWGTIHQDDVAELFLLVGEAAPICKHLIFDAVNPASESVDLILSRVAQIAGLSGYQYRAPANAFEEAVAAQSLTRPSLGRALLGWTPKKMGIVDGLEGYWNAWEASLSGK